MNNSTRKTLSALAALVSKVLLGVGGLLFLFGGRALHEFAGVPFLLAEMEGDGLAALCLAGGALVMGAVQNLEVPQEMEDPLSVDEPDRK